MKIDFLTDINKDYQEAMNYAKVDRFMVKILWWHFGIFALQAFAASILKVAEKYPSPFAWRVISPLEASVALMIAVAASTIPTLLVGKMKNHYAWRVIVTVCLVFYSYLFIFISGGSIEMHFHFFMVIALLIVYADWRLEWILLVLTALHHGILNYVEPGWVYFYGRNDFAVIAHALPVFADTIFTTIICQYYRGAVIALESAKGSLEQTVDQRTKELKDLNAALDTKIKERTEELEKQKHELEEQKKELQRTNDLMIGRELKMAELKKKLDTTGEPNGNPKPE